MKDLELKIKIARAKQRMIRRKMWALYPCIEYRVTPEAYNFFNSNKFTP